MSELTYTLIVHTSCLILMWIGGYLLGYAACKRHLQKKLKKNDDTFDLTTGIE